MSNTCNDCGAPVDKGRRFCDYHRDERRKESKRGWEERNRAARSEKKRTWEKTHYTEPCHGHCGTWIRKNGSGYCRECSPRTGTRGRREWDYSTI